VVARRPPRASENIVCLLLPATGYARGLLPRARRARNRGLGAEMLTTEQFC